MKRFIIISVFFGIIGMVSSCGESPTPKPKAFSRIDKIDSGIQKYTGDFFSFLYSKEATITFAPSNDKDEVWMNVSYPHYNATIHCTYLAINKKKRLDDLLNDSYQLAFTHSSKASSINGIEVHNKSMESSGILYDIDGPVASPVQFYMTDSIRNFLMGSLYYDQVVNADSVSSVTHFVREDILQLMESIEWKN